MKHFRWAVNLAAVAAVALVTFLGWQWLGPKAAPLHVTGQVQAIKPLHVTAVGDSLTHGVGDDTDNGGYVGLLKADLSATGNYAVTTSNFGVTGDTSSQILKRVTSQKKLQADLRQANVITLTVGGNDLMHVLQNNLLTLSTKSVTAGNTKFQKRLAKLLTTLRSYNAKAPIYVFGIYNPFYVYFPKLTAMTTSVQAWNNGTKATVATFKRAYYVDIDSVLTKGTGTQKATAKAKASLAEAMSGSGSANPLIFDEDHFHPNNAGYALMTSQLWTRMQQTKGTWQ